MLLHEIYHQIYILMLTPPVLGRMFLALTQRSLREFSLPTLDHTRIMSRFSPSHPESLEVSTERHKMDFIHYRGLHTRLTEGDG